MAAKTPTARVDKLLGSMGYGSRAEMARMGKAGGIVLDGVDLTDVSKRIPVTPDLPSRMEIDGEPLDPVQGLVMLLNKPLAPAVLEVVSPTEALLKTGGVLWLVANRHLPYEAELNAAFKRVKPVLDKGGYKIFEAVK